MSGRRRLPKSLESMTASKPLGRMVQEELHPSGAQVALGVLLTMKVERLGGSRHMYVFDSIREEGSSLGMVHWVTERSQEECFSRFRGVQNVLIDKGEGRWLPYTVLEKPKPPYKVSGVLVNIMDIIVTQLNECYRVVVPEGEDWGRQLKNGTVTGMMGQLQRSEVDMSLTPLGISHWRWQLVDFSEPLFMDETRVIYQRPTPQADIAGFAKPYSSLVWLLLLLCVVFVFMVTFLTQMAWVLTRDEDGHGEEEASSMGPQSRFGSDTGMWIWTDNIRVNFRRLHMDHLLRPVSV
ncbi:hypothetical protein Pcinc_030819 [Petrolisthes cinctipes]|uniref:Ionotropic glutamate receptor L-glutamate and glycine-binding domain-containing protein n=1 Tax=Petrolisthes cinctipes TaxID=88211 RepID=A0AAE1K3W7_PETCI|nr:hypothetical protein Pcinc_030819 [Petrolisthes cinctipes]